MTAATEGPLPRHHQPGHGREVVDGEGKRKEQVRGHMTMRLLKDLLS